jgi:hypothetical protein
LEKKLLNRPVPFRFRKPFIDGDNAVFESPSISVLQIYKSNYIILLPWFGG